MTFSDENRYRNTINIKEQTQMNKFNLFLNRSKRFGELNLFGNKNKINVNKRLVILVQQLPYVGKDECLYRFEIV